MGLTAEGGRALGDSGELAEAERGIRQGVGGAGRVTAGGGRSPDGTHSSRKRSRPSGRGSHTGGHYLARKLTALPLKRDWMRIVLFPETRNGSWASCCPHERMHACDVYMLTPIPQPASLFLAGVAGVVLTAKRRFVLFAGVAGGIYR